MATIKFRKAEKVKRIDILLTEDLYKRAVAQSKSLGISISELFRQMAEHTLDKLPPDNNTPAAS